MQITPNHKRNSAFTLIELLVVIAIIAILAAILFPVFARARENARRSSCQSNLKQIGIGILQYTQDYDEKFPRSRVSGIALPANPPANPNPVASQTDAPWHVVVQPYIKSYQVFKCPSNTSTATHTRSNGLVPISYVSNGGGTEAEDNTNFGGIRPMGAQLAPGTAIAQIASPSQLLLVGEHPTRNEPEFYSLSVNSMTFQNHLGTTNFLFADGHVKAVRPTQLATPVNMWNVTNAPAPNLLLDKMVTEEAKLK